MSDPLVYNPGWFQYGTQQTLRYGRPDPFAAPGSTPLYLKPQYSDASLEQARRQALFDPQESLNQQILLARAGYLSADDVDGMWSADVQKALASAMGDANTMYMSLEDYLRVKGGYKASRDGSGGGRGSGPSGPRTSVSVSKSVRLTSRASAQSLLKQTLAIELGREPTSAEVARFVSALNKEEKADPTVSTTTTTINGSNSSSNTVTKESQVDPGSEAETYAEKVNPAEAHRYQSGNYYDVIARMVGGA